MATCTRQDCTETADPKSTKGYCKKHKAEARQAWRENIAASNETRKASYEAFAELVDKAHQAGVLAAANKVPTPMIVAQHAHPLVDTSPIVRAWVVPEGTCGFAWVTVHPGNSSFARWLVKHRGWQSGGYGSGGVGLWVSDYKQSLELKEAYADAYKLVLREAGFQAFSHSRMD